MKLNFSNWMEHTDWKKGDLIPSIVAAGILTATWLWNRKRGEQYEYVAHMKPFKTPKETVMKMPGVYITKQKIEGMDLHADTDETTTTGTDREGTGPLQHLLLERPRPNQTTDDDQDEQETDQ